MGSVAMRAGVAGLLALAGSAWAQPWSNLGGNAQRNGLTTAVGPVSSADLLWTNSDIFSIISWHPVIEDRRVFVIRETAFPGATPGDLLLCYDLDTGVEVWRVEVPYSNSTDDWIAYVAGVNGGRVYAARGGSGRTSPIYAFDVADGSPVWTSAFETVAGPQDGIVFAPDGDLIVGDFDFITRLEASDGSTVWSTPRDCSISGNCGASMFGGAVYIDEQTPQGPAVSRVDAATGAIQYSTPGTGGLTAQNAPFVGPDGTVYFARSQNNAVTDFLYSWTDTGSAFVLNWSVPIRWTTSHEHGVGADGSIYTFAPGNEFVRLSPVDGSVINTAGVLGPIGTNLSPRTAVDGDGKVYVSNGWASTPASDGRLWAFSGDLSQQMFVLNLDRQNAGGPSLGTDGTLVMSDRSAVRAFRSTPSGCAADLTGSSDPNDPSYGVPDGDADGDDVGRIVRIARAGQVRGTPARRAPERPHRRPIRHHPRAIGPQ
ncbi:MAG: PQQ-binding-like beta-propeller repeat protein, partial [Phycisphaerales bacterium JB037]